MAHDVRTLQARCAALRFWPGPIDGDLGARTRTAIAAATRAQEAKGRPFIHPSGLTRIHFHWTGGNYTPNAVDQKHYHFIIDGDGVEHDLHDPTKVLAHTRDANDSAIGISLAAMVDAVERPFSPGPCPVLERQVAALARLSASLCARYDIPVSRFSTLSHSEVQPTLRIKQRQKWDINWLPGMAAPGDPITVGDRIRVMIARDLKSLKQTT